MITKRLVLIAAVAASIGLAGCKTTDEGGGAAPIAPGKVTQAIAQVQEYTRKACGFIPTVNTVANLLQVFGVPSISAYTQIASEVCSAVTKQQARRNRSSRGPTVRGVRIQGTFAAR